MPEKISYKFTRMNLDHFLPRMQWIFQILDQKKN